MQISQKLLSDPAFIADPYPIYAHLRDADPVYQIEPGLWLITRYEDVFAALTDPRLSNQPGVFATVHRANSGIHAAASVANNLIAFMDAPEHTAPRRLIASTFSKSLKDKQPLVKQVAADIYESLRGRAAIDYLKDFAVPYAVRCICILMGFPEEDGPTLERWSNLLFYLFLPIPNQEVLNQVNQSLSEFRRYVIDVIEKKRCSPKEDILTFLVQSTDRDHGLSDQQLVDNVMLLVADGIENVQAGLATAVLTLLQHPDEFSKLAKNIELLPTAIDECLRYESPGQYQGRIVKESFQLGGKDIRRHSIVLLGLASANRDEKIFHQADRFMVERKGPRHLAFGFGNHACIGGPLVALEFRCALQSLFDGNQAIELIDDEISWTARAGHRWPSGVPVRIADS